MASVERLPSSGRFLRASLLRCLEDAWRMLGGCLEDVWRIFFGCGAPRVRTRMFGDFASSWGTAERQSSGSLKAETNSRGEKRREKGERWWILRDDSSLSLEQKLLKELISVTPQGSAKDPFKTRTSKDLTEESRIINPPSLSSWLPVEWHLNWKRY